MREYALCSGYTHTSALPRVAPAYAVSLLLWAVSLFPPLPARLPSPPRARDRDDREVDRRRDREHRADYDRSDREREVCPARHIFDHDGTKRRGREKKRAGGSPPTPRGSFASVRYLARHWRCCSRWSERYPGGRWFLFFVVRSLLRASVAAPSVLVCLCCAPVLPVWARGREGVGAPRPVHCRAHSALSPLCLPPAIAAPSSSPSQLSFPSSQPLLARLSHAHVRAPHPLPSDVISPSHVAHLRYSPLPSSFPPSFSRLSLPAWSCVPRIWPLGPSAAPPPPRLSAPSSFCGCLACRPAAARSTRAPGLARTVRGVFSTPPAQPSQPHPTPSTYPRSIRPSLPASFSLRLVGLFAGFSCWSGRAREGKRNIPRS